MIKYPHVQKSAGWNYLSIAKLQRHSSSLGTDKWFHSTHYGGSDYISMLRLNFIHVNKRGPWGVVYVCGVDVHSVSRFNIPTFLYANHASIFVMYRACCRIITYEYTVPSNPESVTEQRQYVSLWHIRISMDAIYADGWMISAYDIRWWCFMCNINVSEI